ncbi:glycoside hydrolase family 3 protein [Rhizobium laguerreae]|uniref:glycoside hydrolase family 3 N-terminal domain-containing protein n=1 Tax=Rhizobium laguerreae TaxID=1076926 RepID=UPI001C924A45|nr:glycoside hydrolase family 3 N-terminal domain-containing protein [Rhizobium laguerreae]MBY3150813.1 glycoside hydrolase family 3 protein [Rhizobium laguerreae]
MKRTVNAILLALMLLPISSGSAGGLEEKPRPQGSKIGDDLLRRMIGQMVLVGFVGNRQRDGGFQTVARQAGKGRLAGVLYLGRNIRTLDGVKAMNEALQAAAAGLPLLVAVDQEGGRIERLTKAVGFNEMPSAASVAQSMTPKEAQATYKLMAIQLAGLGFNLNLGPVVDLNTNPNNPIIGRLGRSFSADGEKTTEYGRAFVEGHRQAGVLTALKHFPGHGSSVGDTHNEVVDVSETWKESELVPYEELIDSGDADMVMSAHVINRNIPGAERTPASMSPATLVGLLRKKLRFKGVIISDDLQMEAIAGTMGFDDTVLHAVMAGNDILVFANDKHPDPTIPDRVSDLLVVEARENPALMMRIQESYGRVVRLKSKIEPKPMSR